MAAKVYEIAFQLAGKLSNNFQKSFQAGKKTLTEFEKELQALNRTAAQLDGVKKARLEVAEAARANIQAKQRVVELGRAMAQSGAPTKKLAAEMKRAQEAARKSREVLERKRETLKRVDAAAGTTGKSLRDLTQRQNEVKTASDKARMALEKQNAILAKQARLNEKASKAAEAQSKLHSAGARSAGTIAAVGAAAYGTVGLPIKEAMALEDAMAEVRKVTNFTPEGLIKARQELEIMSTRIPMSADGLAQIMASAAQSGVAQEELIGFTEQAAKMAVAFDISAEEAGTMMAKWQSGMKLTQEQTYALADAVNALSNTNAATAAQVGEVLKRYGALGKVAGLTEKETAAFAASVVASGAEADVAATGIKAFMRAMGKGNSMSKKQGSAFAAAGIDPVQLQEDLQKNAPEAIIKTLQKIQDNVPAEQLNEYLSVMFGDEAAIAVGPMMQNLEGLQKNFAMVADSGAYADSMLKEFQARSATTSNALTLAKNAALYAARAIGEPLLKPLQQLATQFVQTAMRVGEWIKRNQTLVMGILKVAGVVTSAIVAFHSIRLAIVFLVSPIMSLYRGFLLAQKALLLWKSGMIQARIATIASTTAMIAKSVAMKAATLVTYAITAAQWAWNVALTANPIGIIIVAIGALIAAGVLLWRNWDTIVAKCTNMWAVFSEKFPAIANIVSVPFKQIGVIINTVKAIFSNLIGFIKNVFTGNWSAAWGNIVNIFSAVWNGLINFVRLPVNAIIGIVNGAIRGINSIKFTVPDWVPGIGGKGWQGLGIPQIPMLAKGGIATAPTLAMIGEGRENEAVLPLSKLDSMLSGDGAGGSINITFAPIINIESNSSNPRTQVEQGLRTGMTDLKRELEKLMKQQRRVSFA